MGDKQKPKRLDKISLYPKILLDPNLNNEESRTAGIILGFRNDFTGKCVVTQTKIADVLEVSQQKVARIIDALRRKDVLATVWTINPKTYRRGPCQYFFLDDISTMAELAENGIPDTIKNDFFAVTEKPRVRAVLQTKNTQS